MREARQPREWPGRAKKEEIIIYIKSPVKRTFAQRYPEDSVGSWLYADVPEPSEAT
jgi:hypothetical protein